MGQNRTVFDPQTSLPSGFQKVEWLAAYSMAASNAVLLRDALSSSIALYEKSFGKIPVDPNSRLAETGMPPQ
jgi:hypothetical protein